MFDILALKHVALDPKIMVVTLIVILEYEEITL